MLLYQMLYQYAVSDILSIFKKEHEENTNNSLIRITFKIKTGYYLKLLTPETKELLGCTKSKKTKDDNGENASHLEITKVVLLHCNILASNYQHDSRVLYTYIYNKSCDQLLDIPPKYLIF